MNDRSSDLGRSSSWRLLEGLVVSVTQLALYVLVARQTAPAEFATYAILAAILAFGSALSEAGLTSSLIQKKGLHQSDFSSVLALNFCLSMSVALVIIASDTVLTKLYELPLLSTLLPVTALCVVTSGIVGISRAVFIRQMQFKILAIIGISSALLSSTILLAFTPTSIISISLLVYHVALTSCLNVIFLTSIVYRKFLYKISLNLWPPHIAFGTRMLSVQFTEMLHNAAMPLIIGYAYSPHQLGLFNNARQWPAVVSAMLFNAFSSTSFAALSRLQSDRQLHLTKLRYSVSGFCCILLFFIFYVVLVAELLVVEVLGEQWIESVDLLVIFCAYFAVSHTNNISLTSLSSLGMTREYMKAGLIQRSLSWIFLALTLTSSVYHVLIGQVLASILSAVIVILVCQRGADYHWRDQLSDRVPYFVLAIIAAKLGSSALHTSGPLGNIVAATLIYCFVYIGAVVSFKLRGADFPADILNLFRLRI